MHAELWGTVIVARRSLPTAAALTVGTALLLTACGGGGDDSSDKIEGAGGGSDKPSASASASADADRPDVSVPKDLDLVFDFSKPSNPKHAAALADAENYIRALDHGIAKQDPDDPAYKFYSGDPQPTQYAKSQIEAWVKDGWTVTGRDRYSRATTKDVGGGKRVLVTFCRNQSEFFSKKVKTGKVNRTEESLNSYQRFNLLMAPSKDSSSVWRAHQIVVKGKVEECKA